MSFIQKLQDLTGGSYGTAVQFRFSENQVMILVTRETATGLWAGGRAVNYVNMLIDPDDSVLRVLADVISQAKDAAP